MDDISIVIRSKNESRWIGHCIQSCLDHIDCPEIIIVDNNSSDQTLEIVRHFQHDPTLPQSKKYTNIKILNISDYTPGKALNLGVKNSTRKNILIISSHCVLTNFNLLNLQEKIEKYSCIYGSQTPFYHGKRIQKRYIWAHFGNQEVINLFSDYESRYFMHNALSFFSKNTLLENPFNENLQGKEDRYWAIDMINKGTNILYSPDLSCDHHYTTSGNTWKGIA